jgi:hypothetical protein
MKYGSNVAQSSQSRGRAAAVALVEVREGSMSGQIAESPKESHVNQLTPSAVAPCYQSLHDLVSENYRFPLVRA